MRSLTIAALAALTAAPVAAQGIPLHPPAKYDHAPAMPVWEFVIDAPNVARDCAAATGHAMPFQVSGCQYFHQHGPQTVCVIVLAARSRAASLADLRRHEIAHCNGWTH